jgi:hypothetical protein
VAFKVNYGLERAERNRAKQAKKEAKLKARKNAPGADNAESDISVDEDPIETNAVGGLVSEPTKEP